jgi:hypothetical protein
VCAQVLRVIDVSNAGEQRKAKQQICECVTRYLGEGRKLYPAARLNIAKASAARAVIRNLSMTAVDVAHCVENLIYVGHAVLRIVAFIP